MIRADRMRQYGVAPVEKRTPGKKLVSIVLPAHNEERNLPEVHRRLSHVLSPLSYDLEFIFVDDGSSDRTVDVMDELSRRDPRVKYIGLSRNFGHQYALTAGLDFASGDAVVSLDTDLQHPPELIPTLLQKWEGGAQVVNTIRRSTESITLFKKVSAAVFYRLFRLVSPVQIGRAHV